jgi:hypothetical protein
MKRLLLGCASLALVAATASAQARVTRIEITKQEPFAAGQAFGNFGAYEKVVGRFRGELTRLCRGDQPVLQFLWMAGFGSPDHQVFREGETQPGVDPTGSGEAERLRRHPARQCYHERPILALIGGSLSWASPLTCLASDLFLFGAMRSKDKVRKQIGTLRARISLSRSEALE